MTQRRHDGRTHGVRPITAAGALLATLVGIASIPTGASELQVNTFIVGDQAYPAVCRDPSGRTVVVWESRDQDGSKNGVRARRYDPSGAPAGDEIAVNVFTDDDQQLPAVTCRPDGSFLVAWESRGQDGDDFGIIAERFDASGARLGNETVVNTTTAGRQAHPAVCSDAEGNFVIAWQSDGQDGDGLGIVAQRFAADGIRRGGELMVNTFTARSQTHPAIACTDRGAFVIAWDSHLQDGDGEGVFAQAFGPDGERLGDERRVNTTTRGTQHWPAVARVPTGDVVIAWESYDDQDGDSAGIFAQRFAADGTPRWGELQLNAVTTHNQEKPSIAALDGGGFAVAWSSPDGDGSGVFVRQFGPSGAPLGPEAQVNAYTHGDQGVTSRDGHALAVAPGAEPLIVWQSTALTGAPQDGSGAGVFTARVARLEACAGDCSADRAVTVDELVRGVSIALGATALPACLAFDLDGNDEVTIAELVAAVNAALQGCV